MRSRRPAANFSSRVTSAVGAAVLIGSSALAVAAPAGAASGGPGPVIQPPASTVSAQSLPTAQVDGVVWSQAVAGNTVYVGGQFTQARPAGAAPGVGTVSRTDLMAYNLSTGVMTSFAPVIDTKAQVYAVAVTPDQSKVFVAGSFTSINGVARNRIAGFDATTGALLTSFAPLLNYNIKSLAVTNSTVYAGGAFISVGSAARNRAAAFDATSGALLAWNPNVNDTVQALTVAPDNKSVYLGGAFDQVGTTATRGLAKVDANTGAVQSWPAATVVGDHGPKSAILSLSHDATNVYGSGYVVGNATGNLEGSFASNLSTGALTWVEDCHGDTYGTYASGTALYVVGHPHDCARVGGFPETDPTSYHQALAWTPQATGTLLPWTGGKPYSNWGGRPSPSMQNWFPTLADGTYTGIGQAAWTITGTSQYVLMGGEFPSVNGTGQQGLARFALRSVAPSHEGPQLTGSKWVPTARSSKAGTATVTVPSNWDRDDLTLTYTLFRNGDRTHPVTSTTAKATFWQNDPVTLTDSAAPAGTDSYVVEASDGQGNVADSATTTVTVTGSGGNQPPAASFTTTTSGLSVSANGGGSTDSDGRVTGWAWTFGDGTAGSGSTVSHVYKTSGTYTVTLTVTDNKGATASTSRTVTVGTTSTAVARDGFARAVTNGWGSADTGGSWTVSGSPASAFAVAGGAGTIAISRGWNASAELTATSASDTDSTVNVSLDQAASGGGVMIFLAGRHQGNSYYGMRAKVLAGGQVQVSVSKVVNGTDTQLSIVTVPDLTYTAGMTLRLRLQISGTQSVTVRAKAWNSTQTEPTSWQASGTDSTSPLGAGDVWLSSYVSGSATAATTTLSVSNLAVVPYTP